MYKNASIRKYVKILLILYSKTKSQKISVNASNYLLSLEITDLMKQSKNQFNKTIRQRVATHRRKHMHIWTWQDICILVKPSYVKLITHKILLKKTCNKNNNNTITTTAILWALERQQELDQHQVIVQRHMLLARTQACK